MTSRRAIFQLGSVAAIGSLAGCGSTETPQPPKDLKPSDVPVGGGLILQNPPYVVTQAEAGQFKAFSNLCTHSGCKVSSIERRGILCACHGSIFALKDGAVVRGPAEKPLPEIKVTVNGDRLVFG